MGGIVVANGVRRWVMPAAAVPLTVVLVHQSGDALAVGLSAASVLAGVAAATLRHVLRHVLQVQQQRDGHEEAMFRETNRHAEIALLLGAVNPTVDGVEVARAIRDIRGAAGPDG